MAIFYRVHYHHEGGVSQGYGWFTSKTKAEREAASFVRRTASEDGTAHIDEPIIIGLTKRGVLEALNKWATYADNG